MSGCWAGLYTSIQGQESPNMGDIPSDDSSYGYSQARGWEEWCFRSACESSSGPHEWDRALKFYWVPEHCFVFKMVTPIPQLYPISVGKCRWNQNKRDSRGKEEDLLENRNQGLHFSVWRWHRKAFTLIRSLLLLLQLRAFVSCSFPVAWPQCTRKLFIAKPSKTTSLGALSSVKKMPNSSFI